MKNLAILLTMALIFTACNVQEAEETNGDVEQVIDEKQAEVEKVTEEIGKEEMTDEVEKEIEVTPEEEVADNEMVYNKESLALFNGKDGNKAYIAIDGFVYDVSEHPLWMEGIHQGRFNAGEDLSEAMKGAPHGLSKLDGLEVVGSYE